MSALLVLRKLRMSVNGQRLLDLPEFEVPERSCMVLSGRNGAGKTTLLRIVAGLLEPDQGEVEFAGRRQGWKAARELLRQDCIYLHQHPYMFDRSVWENVAFGLRQTRIRRPELQQRVDQALDWAGLSHLAGRNARQLSGGEKQRVALTRARVLSPRLLLLDEPLANMDLESRHQTLGLIRSLKDEGIASIVTGHEPYVGQLLGDLHRHLCKTGPARYTIVEPFLYQRPVGQEFPMSERQRPVTPTPDAAGVPREAITAVIMAGGKGRRMGGQDKGLLEVGGRPLIEYVRDALQPQVGRILINANRNRERYEGFGCPVIEDISGGYLGPLVGMASGLATSESDYLLAVPCDSPLVPEGLAERLYLALQSTGAQIAVAHDGSRMQPVFSLLKRDLLPDLRQYLEHGGRKIDTWYAQHPTALADFSEYPDAFLNINTEEERQELERKLTGRQR